MSVFGSRKLGQLACLVAVTFFSGCSGGDSASGPSTPLTNTAVAGTYVLQSVEGVSLPAPVRDADGRTFFGSATAGTFTLTSEGTFTQSRKYVLTSGTPVLSQASGTYTVSGSTVNFTQSNGGMFPSATFSGGNTLTTGFNFQDWVYKK